MIQKIKELLLPNRPVKCPVLFGPFRGSRPLLNPRTSLRYILGLYEHQLNSWTSGVIPRVSGLFDVGANHGYFSFGVMAAWRRLGKAGRVWAFEPQPTEAQLVRSAAAWHESENIKIDIENSLVGNTVDSRTTTLDHFIAQQAIGTERFSSLVKIDVEGAEIQVLEGAETLLRSGNFFVVEAHSAELLRQVEEFFKKHHHETQTICEPRMPVVGRPSFLPENWWVVSRV